MQIRKCAARRIGFFPQDDGRLTRAWWHSSCARTIDLNGLSVGRALHVRSTGSDAEAVSFDDAWFQAPLILGPHVSLKKCSLRRVAGLDQLRLSGSPFSSVDGFPRVIHDPAFGYWPEFEMNDRELASTYRQLRAGLESVSNAPAATGFYFGEMEARRRAAISERDLVERVVLSTYRFTSFYGLRAVRPLLAFVALPLIATVLLRLGGGLSPFEVDGDQPVLSFADSLMFAFSSSTSFLRPIGDQLAMDLDERLIQAVLRIAGPALIAMSLLAVRNRVKR